MSFNVSYKKMACIAEFRMNEQQAKDEQKMWETKT